MKKSKTNSKITNKSIIYIGVHIYGNITQNIYSIWLKSSQLIINYDSNITTTSIDISTSFSIQLSTIYNDNLHYIILDNNEIPNHILLQWFKQTKSPLHIPENMKMLSKNWFIDSCKKRKLVNFEPYLININNNISNINTSNILNINADTNIAPATVIVLQDTDNDTLLKEYNDNTNTHTQSQS
jgi:hypothetical protein